MASVDAILTARELAFFSITESEKFTHEDTSFQAEFTRKLLCMRKQGQLTDITLRAGVAEARCHKVTLAAASDYFSDLINSGKVSNVVQLHNMSPACLNAIVDYLYTGHLEVSAQYIKEIAASCDRLQLTSVKKAADRYIAEKTTTANSISIMMFAKEHHLQLTINKATQVLLQYSKDILHVASDEEFKALSESSLIDWISSDDLEVPEEDSVFLLVQRWVQADSARDNEACVTKVLSKVRLPLCTPGFLIKTVQRSPLLRFHKCQQLLQEAKDYGYLRMANESTEGLESERTRPRKSSIQGHVSSHVGVESEGTRQMKSNMNRLILVGGVDKTGRSNTKCWELCRDGTQWTELAQLPQALVQHPYGTAACTVADGVIITGGSTGIVGGACRKQAWLYSTVTKHWSALPQMHKARGTHGMVSDGKCVYVCGGHNGQRVMSSVERLDEHRHSWTYIASLPLLTYYNHAFCIDSSIFVVSGDQRKTQQYNIKFNVWSVKADMPCADLGAAMTCVGKCIYVIGMSQRQCLMYDTTCDTWTQLVSPLHLHNWGSAVLHQGKLLICGGSTRGPTAGYTESIEEYDMSTHTWSMSKLTLPKPLHNHHMLVL